ncbi:hypothetical protein Aeqsu_1211 [Aequorivita sublithincola DSM 14238]|uniref:Uncharacterized protein n=1 Tax=Aequorivita sublithincola (strain DSM 14238 / LMG 21431 / ACAM 643 / 9-3) TaxID=746697 RepID=I3YUN9_AEQSU|nr:hypothetical protein [Aequorivita sublithincola]AFL80707.1 hypothetical protein Aeqsu_1211 [Aequorivita sublithincola DSM 14238]
MEKFSNQSVNGQLRRCINNVSASFPDLEFVFISKENLNIKNFILLKSYAKQRVFQCKNSNETVFLCLAKHKESRSEKLKEASLAKTNHYRTFAAPMELSFLDNSKDERTFMVSIRGRNESYQSVFNYIN